MRPIGSNNNISGRSEARGRAILSGFLLKSRRRVSGKSAIEYTIYSKFATLNDLKKLMFFPKNPLIFPKNRSFNVLRNVTISVAFYGKCATIW